MQICHLQCLTAESRRGCRKPVLLIRPGSITAACAARYTLDTQHSPFCPKTHTHGKSNPGPSPACTRRSHCGWFGFSALTTSGNWNGPCSSQRLLPVPSCQCPKQTWAATSESVDSPSVPRGGRPLLPTPAPPTPPLTRWLSRGSWSRSAMLSRSLNTGQSGQGENRARQQFHSWNRSQGPSKLPPNLSYFKFIFIFGATPYGLQDLSSPTRDETQALGSESTESCRRHHWKHQWATREFPSLFYLTFIKYKNGRRMLLAPERPQFFFENLPRLSTCQLSVLVLMSN